MNITKNILGGYNSFGMPMPGRTFNPGEYRFGYNGKENDNEVKGNGNQQDYGFRIYDARVGRFLSMDPLTESYPSFSPYHYAGNNPIKFIDLDGLETVDPSVERFYKTTPQIDMTSAPAGSKANAAGFPRNKDWFWRQMANKHPEMFSKSNMATIRSGGTPIVDQTWVSFNSSHSEFIGGKLIHHHVNQGKMAVGIPEKVHLDFFKELHPELGAKTLRGARIGTGFALNGLSVFGDLASAMNGNPDSWMFMFGREPSIGNVQKDSNSGLYFTPLKINKTFYDDGSLKSVIQTHDVYSDYIWSEDNKKYMGVNKIGTETRFVNYAKDGSVSSEGSIY